MFYRLLRQDESIANGLCAKNIDSTTSVFVHVINGSYGPQSKYISTCGSLAAVDDLRSKSTQPGNIVKIDEDNLRLNDVEIIDLRCKKNQRRQQR